jgi:hypothetical protein
MKRNNHYAVKATMEDLRNVPTIKAEMDLFVKRELRNGSKIPTNEEIDSIAINNEYVILGSGLELCIPENPVVFMRPTAINKNTVYCLAPAFYGEHFEGICRLDLYPFDINISGSVPYLYHSCETVNEFIHKLSGKTLLVSQTDIQNQIRLDIKHE